MHVIERPTPRTAPAVNGAAKAGVVPSRDLSADVARAIAILLVIVVHVSVPVCQAAAVGSGPWWIANLYLSIARIGVPLFVMLSGLFLLDPSRNESIGGFFRRRLSKVAVPFVSWAIVYLYLKHRLDGQPFGLRHVVGEILQGPVYTHFWFFYMLFGLYLATPILRPLVRHAGPRVLGYFLGLWVVAQGLLPLLQSTVHLKVAVDVVVATGYVGYFVGGRVLADVPGKRGRGRLAWGFCLGVALTAALAFAASRRAGGFDETWTDSRSLSVILASASAYLLLRSWKPALNASPLGRPVSLLGRHSFGVYLAHMLVLRMIRNEWGLINPGDHPLLLIPLCVGVVSAVSLGLSIALARVPVLRWTVGH